MCKLFVCKVVPQVKSETRDLHRVDDSLLSTFYVMILYKNGDVTAQSCSQIVSTLVMTQSYANVCAYKNLRS